MKILHVPFTFYPDPVGGTEIYVEALALQLQQFQVASVIAAPASQNHRYEHRGISVHRYTNEAVTDLRTLYGEGDPTAASAFDRILAMERPDVVHLHAFTPSVSLAIVRVTKSRGIPVVFTYHTPTVTCQEGTLMRWGTQPCDGLMHLHTCARCALDGLFNRNHKHVGGIARNKSGSVTAHLLGSLPAVVGSWFARHKLQGRHWTALRMTELVQLRHATIRALFAEVNRVIAVCQWVESTLIRNGVPKHKIVLSRQGVEEDFARPAREQSTVVYPSPLKIAFLGRLDSTKGVDILIRAVRNIPQAVLQFDIYGVQQGQGGLLYKQYLQGLTTGDGRFMFLPPIPRSQVISTLSEYDLLAVPSQWLETGPLVVLEAYAAGIPVIGSRLGGIAELVRDGIDGILVEAADVKAWSNVLLRLSADRTLIQALRQNIRPPRTMTTVAREMATLYEQILRHNVEHVPSAWASHSEPA